MQTTAHAVTPSAPQTLDVTTSRDWVRTIFKWDYTGHSPEPGPAKIMAGIVAIAQFIYDRSWDNNLGPSENRSTHSLPSDPTELEAIELMKNDPTLKRHLAVGFKTNERAVTQALNDFISDNPVWNEISQRLSQSDQASTSKSSPTLEEITNAAKELANALANSTPPHLSIPADIHKFALKFLEKEHTDAAMSSMAHHSYYALLALFRKRAEILCNILSNASCNESEARVLGLIVLSDLARSLAHQGLNKLGKALAPIFNRCDTSEAFKGTSINQYIDEISDPAKEALSGCSAINLLRKSINTLYTSLSNNREVTDDVKDHLEWILYTRHEAFEGDKEREAASTLRASLIDQACKALQNSNPQADLQSAIIQLALCAPNALNPYKIEIADPSIRKIASFFRGLPPFLAAHLGLITDEQLSAIVAATPKPRKGSWATMFRDGIEEAKRITEATETPESVKSALLSLIANFNTEACVQKITSLSETARHTVPDGIVRKQELLRNLKGKVMYDPGKDRFTVIVWVHEATQLTLSTRAIAASFGVNNEGAIGNVTRVKLNLNHPVAKKLLSGGYVDTGLQHQGLTYNQSMIFKGSKLKSIPQFKPNLKALLAPISAWRRTRLASAPALTPPPDNQTQS